MNKNNKKIDVKQKIIDEYMNLDECKNCKFFYISKNRTITCNFNLSKDNQCIILNKYLNLNP